MILIILIVIETIMIVIHTYVQTNQWTHSINDKYWLNKRVLLITENKDNDNVDKINNDDAKNAGNDNEDHNFSWIGTECINLTLKS